MHKRTALQSTLLIATILLATACNQQAPDATTQAAVPAATPDAASPVADASPAATPSTAGDASAPAPAAEASASPASGADAAAAAPPKGAPAGPAPVEGGDYTTIDTPDQPTGDKVQVTEVFGYGCPHCAKFQPELAKWEKTLPADVQFNYLPAAFGPDPAHCWDDFARAFYAAQAMGIQEKSHDSIYKEVFDQHRFNGCQTIPSLYSDFGVDTKVFASTMQSFAVNAKVAAAHEQVVRWGVDGTPTMVVDGKYRVSELVSTGPQGMFRTIEWLIAQQRPLHAKH
jgi:thiol:disulfide interchange protein DsbA